MTSNSAPAVLKNIAKALLNDPEKALASIGLAACRAFEDFAISRPEFVPNADTPVMRQKLVARILNFEPFTAMRDLKGMTVGAFVAVRGTIVRVSTIRQQLVSMQFQCNRCSETQVVTFQDYKYSNPSSCPTDRCRSRHFSPMRESAETVDWQRIRIQEIQQRDSDPATAEEGRIPRTIDAELFADLIDSCVPGDIATVCGIVKVMTVEGPSQSKGTNSLYYMYVEANSISTMRSRSSTSPLNSAHNDRIVSETTTPTVHTVIREVVSEKDPFGFLVHSAVPSIFGHEMVKAGLLLALFGGSSKADTVLEASQNSDRIAIRSDIHCLVVGDPGLGKSQMLKAFCNIAPRGVYVCGNTSSTAGLTVTVVRESTGDFALEAGALVLGDGGICCIDEFDKMGAEHGALLEAMEQQSVSVAKAGLLCNLSARTTVLAAANPVGGHYDRSKTVCENLKIALPLLSRFDLVYILMDKADEARDRFISRHVMQTFGTRCRGGVERGRGGGAWRNADRPTGGGRSVAAAAAEAAAATQAQAMARDTVNGTSSQQNLEMRLRGTRVRDPLPSQLFREYIAYAREHVHPTLSDGAKRVLQSFYLELRKASHEKTTDTTPVTTRQLESMIRLSEARARAVMRTVVTANDARDVVEILRTCMVAEVTDEFGTVDLDRTSGMSGASAKFKFVKRLQVEARRTGNKTFSTSMMKSMAKDMGVQGVNFSKLLDSINSLGFILKKGNNTWALANVDAD